MFKRLRERYSRVKRHAAALLRYPTARRIMNLARVEYERKTGKSRLRGRPYYIVIDPVNRCNLKCPFCPTGQGALPLPSGSMPLERYREIIDKIAPHAIKLVLYNWGEPFLHRDILDMIRVAHEKKIATSISSNLNILPSGGGEGIVQSGLDDLIVSCDGLSQKSYEKYRRGGILEKVKENLKQIVEARGRLGKKNPVIEFQFLAFRHNEHEIPDVEAFARGLGADFVRICKPYLNVESEEIRPASNPAYVRTQYLDESISQTPRLDIFSPEADQEACVRNFPPPLDCFWPWRAMVINWNGQVDPCCGKNYLEGFGNLFEQDFEEIWNGPRYRFARAWIRGRVKNNPRTKIVCRGCPGYEP